MVAAVTEKETPKRRILAEGKLGMMVLTHYSMNKWRRGGIPPRPPTHGITVAAAEDTFTPPVAAA